jgi:hypothetical protein
VDDDFLAHYQMNYGFNDTSTAASAEKDAGTGDKKETTDEQLGVKRKAGPQDPSKFVLYNTCHLITGSGRLHFHFILNPSACQMDRGQGGTCSTREDSEKCIQNFGKKRGGMKPLGRHRYM